MRLLLFIFSFLLLFKQETLAQNNSCKCISGEKELRQIDSLFNQKEFLKILPLIDKIPIKETACKQEKLFSKIQLYVSTNKIPDAEAAINELRQLQPEKSCDALKMRYYYQLGNYCIKAEKSDSAMQHFIVVKEISEKLKDSLFQYKALSRIAFVFGRMQQPTKAIEYDYLELFLAKEMKNEKLILQAYSNMQAHFGILYDLTEDKSYIDSVKKIAAPTLLLAKKLRQNFETAQTYSVLCGIAYLEKDYKKGLLLCDSGLSFLNRSKDFRQIHSLLTKKCDIYIELKDFIKAKQYADSSLRYAMLEDNALSLAFIYERMYEIEKLQGNFSNSLMYHRCV